MLVNVSFYVCQIAVDLSNILGYSLKDLFQGIATSVQTASGSSTSTTDESGNFGGIVTIVLASATLIWINIGALIVALVGAIVALLTIFVLLVARKALIILLIAIAPLAFVAYLLPNTEQYFQKWRKALTSLLLLFPVIGVLMGASALASAILLSVAPGAGTDSSGTDSPVTIMKIAAYMVLVVPLVAAIPLLKGSLDGIGKIEGAIQGLGAKAGSASKGKAQKTYDNSRLGQFRKYRQGAWDRRRARIQSGNDLMRGGAKNPINWLSRANRGANRISGRFGSDLTAGGAELQQAELEREVKNADSLMKQHQLSSDERMALARGEHVQRNGQMLIRSSQANRIAAIREGMRTGTVDEMESIILAAGQEGVSRTIRREVAEGVPANVAKADHFGGDFYNRVINGQVATQADLDAAAARRVDEGRLSADTMVNQDAATLARFARVAADAASGARTDVAAARIDQLADAAQEAMANEQLRGKITGQKANPVNTISHL